MLLLKQSGKCTIKDIYRRIHAIKWLYPIMTRDVLIIKGYGYYHDIIFENIAERNIYFITFYSSTEQIVRIAFFDKDTFILVQNKGL